MVMASPDVTVLVCEKDLLKKMSFPAHVPVAELEEFVCSTNWTSFMMSMYQMYDTSTLGNQVSV
jgi:hypothetical protein